MILVLESSARAFPNSFCSSPMSQFLPSFRNLPLVHLQDIMAHYNAPRQYGQRPDHMSSQTVVMQDGSWQQGAQQQGGPQQQGAPQQAQQRNPQQRMFQQPTAYVDPSSQTFSTVLDKHSAHIHTPHIYPRNSTFQAIGVCTVCGNNPYKESALTPCKPRPAMQAIWLQGQQSQQQQHDNGNTQQS